MDDENRRKQEIIDAAIRVFSDQGFDKATIKQIAAEASLKSPSLIYWYFKDKDELLQAVIDHLSPVIHAVQAGTLPLDLPPQELLLLFANGFFTAFNNPKAPRLLRIFLTEALRSQAMVESVVPNLLPVLQFLTAYLEHQVQLGRLRPHHTPSAARAFIGSLLVYVLGKEIMTPLGADLPDTDKYVNEIVTIFISGLRAD